MDTPESIKNSTKINNGEKTISIETFIINNFINSNNHKDRLHTETITDVLNKLGDGLFRGVGCAVGKNVISLNIDNVGK
jgi:hypothetical protein